MGEALKLKLVPSVGAGRSIPVRNVLKGAREAKLTSALIIGQHQDGTIYMASTEGPADTLWSLEHAKLWLLNGCPEQELE